MTCCRFSSLKTLLTLMEGNPSIVLNVLPSPYWPVFSCPSLAGFGCPPRKRPVSQFACDLLMKGVPIEMVSNFLGHSSVKITEEHYEP